MAFGNNDLALWKKFVHFRHKESLGFWCPAIIQLPFGIFTIFHPDDDTSWLWACDLDSYSHEEVIQTVAQTAIRYDVTPSFLISPVWTGDVSAFKKSISAAGYRASLTYLAHVLEDFSPVSNLPESGCDIEICEDGELAGRIFNSCFGLQASNMMGQMIANQITMPRSRLEVRFFIARTKSGEPAGIGACSYDNGLGYLHCLGVMPDYRGQNIAKHLVKFRINALRDRGAEKVITVVSSKNEASLAVQKTAGYRIFATAENWKTAP